LIKEFNEKNSKNSFDCVIGDNFRDIQSLIPSSSKEKLEEETVNIYKNLKFDGDTGLVVGYIQSGKTISFEALTALGRDNDVSVTIILAGISTILSTQTLRRLERDFDINNISQDKWLLQKTLKDESKKSVGLGNNFERDLYGRLASHHNPASLKRRGILIVAMKHYAHIDSITKTLEDKRVNEQLQKSKVLIIDDEADQYSLNSSRNENEISTTNRSILNLRNACPKHTFVQYTATPTGLMLESTLDLLSPDWAENINPGDDYVAINDLFHPSSDLESDDISPYIYPIDEFELDNEDEEHTIPEDLEIALSVFLIGATDGYIKKYKKHLDGQQDTRSMLIHPSRLITDQNQFYTDVEQTIDNWKEIIRFNNDNGAKKDLLHKLKDAYKDLSNTVDNLENFQDIIDTLDIFMEEDLIISLINSGPNATVSGDIRWQQSYGHILVSGNAVDRGTTVEGLTVTYMPRDDSVQIDTQMQRARFLGYKRKYKEYIRIFTTNDTIEFYRKYWITESDFRDLVDTNKGKKFRDAARQWRIQGGKRSCREPIIRIEGALIHNGWNNGRWTLPMFPHLSDNLEENNKCIKDFIMNNTFDPLTEDYFDGEGEYKVNLNLENDSSTHAVATLDFKSVYKDLISYLKFTKHRDMTKMYSVDRYLQYLYNHGDEKDIAVFLMAYDMNEPRERRYNAHGKLTSFQQGRNAEYSGDKKIYNNLITSIQIYQFNILPGNTAKSDEEFFNTYTIGVRLSDRLTNDFNLQEGGTEESIPEQNE